MSRAILVLAAVRYTAWRWYLMLRNAPARHEYWRLWGLVARSRRVCPANAHGALIWHTRSLREILVDDTCRADCADNGACWCWKLRDDNKLRARFADGLASPDGAAPSPAQGAAPLHAHTPRHAATRPRQPWDTAAMPVLREPPGPAATPEDEPEGDPLALWRPYVPYRETWEQWGWPR